MATELQRIAPGASHADVIDRVLDKGIVIDAHLKVTLTGIEILAVGARIIVATIQTYLDTSDALSRLPLAAPPPLAALPPRPI